MRRESETAIRTYALRALARREHSTFELRQKITARFPTAGESTVDAILEDLQRRKYVDDRRYVESVVTTHAERGRPWIEAKLRKAGVDARVSDRALDAVEWPTLAEAVDEHVARMKLAPPLETKDAVRLSRALARLGYDIEEIRLELERLT